MSQDVVKYQAPEALGLSEEQATSIQEAYAINIAGGSVSQFDLPRIKVMSGAPLWLIPALEGDQTAPRIEGVIVATRDARVYYQSKDVSGNTRPDCSSLDGITGVAKPGINAGGKCAKCPLAEWDSAQDGTGAQACKQVKQLFMIRGASMFPEIVSLPPTSLKAARQFFLKLTTSGVPYYHALVAVELEKAENAQKKPYGKAAFKFLRRLTPEEAERALEYHNMCQQLAGQVPTTASDAGNEVAD
jgi:hypothetical protein